MVNKIVSFKKLLRQYEESGLNYKLPVILGEKEDGKPEFADLVDLKHILITGSTGSGKSVFEHNIISTSIKLFPVSQLRLFLVDMKVVEFSLCYKGLPYLLAPVTTKSNDVFSGLEWVKDEKNIRLRRSKSDLEELPYVITIIDTFSDLICNYSKKFQKLIKEAMNKAAEVKIYFIMSDSRTSPDVFTPFIRASFPTKICFNTTSAEASRVIIEAEGGEKLRGSGDMLFFPSNTNKPIRIQAPFISDKEIEDIVTQIKSLKGL